MAFSNSGNLDEAELRLVTFTLPLFALGAVTLPMCYILTRPGLAQLFPDVLVYLVLAIFCLWGTINGERTALNIAVIFGNVVLPVAFGFFAARFAPALFPHCLTLLLLNLFAWLPTMLLREMATPQLRRLQGQPLSADPKKRARSAGSSRASIGFIIIVGTLIFAGAAFSDTAAHLDTFVIGFFALPFYLCVFSLLALGKLLQRANLNPAGPLTITGDLLRPWLRTTLVVLLIGILLAAGIAAGNPWGLLGLDRVAAPAIDSPFAARQGENNWAESSKPATPPPAPSPIPTVKKTGGDKNKPAESKPKGKPGRKAKGKLGGKKPAKPSPEEKSPATTPPQPSPEKAPPEPGPPGNAAPTAPNPGPGDTPGGGEHQQWHQLRDQAADKLLSAALAAAHAGEPPKPPAQQPLAPPKPETPKDKLNRLKNDLHENPWRIVKLVVIGLLALAAGAVLAILLRCWIQRRRQRLAAQRASKANGPTRSPFDDPFTTLPDAPQQEIIRAVYDTFFAYAWLAGYMRKPQQTEFAFADWLDNNTPLNPAPVWLITRRCTQAYYANSDLAPQEMADLHAALQTFMQQTTAKLTPAEIAARQGRYLAEQGEAQGKMSG